MWNGGGRVGGVWKAPVTGRDRGSELREISDVDCGDRAQRERERARVVGPHVEPPMKMGAEPLYMKLPGVTPLTFCGRPIGTLCPSNHKHKVASDTISASKR